MQKIKLESVRRKSGGRVHLTPRVPRSGPVTTLCNQTLGDGSYVAVESEPDCANCIRRSKDQARISGALFAQEEREVRGYPPNLPGAKVETYKTVGDVKLNLYIFDPEGWRRCALAFLEDQAWRSALGGFASTASNSRSAVSRSTSPLSASQALSLRAREETRGCALERQCRAGH